MPRKRTKRANKSKSAKQYVVTLDDAHLKETKSVATKLRERGMQVDEVLDQIGTITGSYDKSPSGLGKIEGVMSVEEQPQVQLPPPDSDVQ